VKPWSSGCNRKSASKTAALQGSAVNQVHHGFGIAQASRRAFRGDFFNAAQIFRSQLHIQSAGVFFQILATLRARNRNDVLALSQQPSERQLPRSAFLFVGDDFHARNQVQILLKILALKTRRETAVVIRSKIFKVLDLAGKETTAERAVGNECDAEFAGRRQEYSVCSAAIG